MDKFILKIGDKIIPGVSKIELPITKELYDTIDIGNKHIFSYNNPIESDIVTSGFYEYYYRRGNKYYLRCGSLRLVVTEENKDTLLAKLKYGAKYKLNIIYK